MSSILSILSYWRHKQPIDNEWHPILGSTSKRKSSEWFSRYQPAWVHRIDGDAAIVDAAPFVIVSGAVAWLRQLPQIGLTAPASVFRNTSTLKALAFSSNAFFSAIVVAQACGLEYRYCIPRWASVNEHLRDDEESRRHIYNGSTLGIFSWMTRTTFSIGPIYTRLSVLDMVLGGALADLLLREHYRAHGM